MTQNIYDDENFFAAYAKLKRSEEGLAGAPEWPSLRAMLPDVVGLRVLDLGCGMGWFCRWASEECALSVTGIDVSEKMLARAKELGGGDIEYVNADMNGLMLVRESYDLIYSSLAFHYLKNLPELIGEISGALAPEGKLVFSVEHPMFTAPKSPEWIERDGGKAWPVTHYLEEGKRTTNWLAPGVVKQHRTMATYLNLLKRNGLTPFHIEEWGPTEAQIAVWSALADERQRPTFLLIGASKN